MGFSDAGVAVSSLFDVGASDERLEQLARMTAAKFWKQPQDERWRKEATFLFRTGGRYLYAVFPIFRRNYYAAARVLKEAIPPGDERLSREDVEVVAVSVLEHDALRIACREVMAEHDG